MTPGLPDPRPTGFGLLSWLWWPVIFIGWGLAGAVMGAEALLGCHSAPSAPITVPAPPRTPRHRARPFLTLLAALAGLSALAACAGPGTDENRDAAVAYCLGDGAPPAPGASTSGGDLASCQAVVEGRYGRGVPR